MFGRSCPRCGNKIKKDFDFCPSCGLNLKSKFDNDDFGMLGKNDFLPEMNKLPFNDNSMDKLLTNAMRDAMKMLKQINENQDKEQKMPGNLNVQFFVNGKKISPQPIQEQKIKEVKFENRLSKETKDRLSSLPREEPQSRMKRIAGKVIYELKVPGVENIDNILINQLENSIEVKAISDDRIYSKTLNIKLPILGFTLTEGNLILELQAQ